MKTETNKRPGRTLLALTLASLWTYQASAATISLSGICSLVDAITAANSDAATGGCSAGSGADVIQLAAGSTHTLATVNNITDGPNGLPSITTDITIEVLNNGTATIQRNSAGGTPAFRLFHVASTGVLTLNDITLSNGLVNTGSNLKRSGGALFNVGQASLNRSTVSGNSASSLGGGIFNHSGSTTTLTHSTVSGNSASGGGGISNSFNTTTLTNSTVSGNSAGIGGGINSGGGATTLINSTVSGNSASSVGGGIFNDGVVATTTLTNSTVSGNNASFGGGIYNYSGATTLTNSTVSGNNASVGGGGISNYVYGTTTLTNSIIANSTGGDCDGALNTANHNWFGDNTCDGAADGDPKLGPLANNGGSTKTHALLAGSGAIDAGNDAVCAAAPVSGKDQRGVTRPDGAHCDIGAYEGFIPDTSFFVIPLPSGKTVIFGL